MSSITVADKSGGRYQAVIEFSYGECERLPFNILRRIGARIKTVPDGGIQAVADFNIRCREESAAFLEMLDMFGEDGSFRHGSAADADRLALTAPPAGLAGPDSDEDDELELDGPLAATDD
ncbi:MAG: hypothetical protein LIP77_03350 [Planctomycetes bacterium]|nr:hypothetical protein [Planctomycetota bacterium]